MGSCLSIAFSSTAATRRPPTAKVIKPDGSFIEYSVPVKVIHVLGTNHPFSFLCDADELFYGDQVQALDTNYLIQLGNIYFWLPIKKLNYALTAAEMAALASLVNVAFSNAVLFETKKKMHDRSNCREFDGYERFNEDTVANSALMRKKNIDERSCTRKGVARVLPVVAGERFGEERTANAALMGVKRNIYGRSRKCVQILPVIVEEFDGYERFSEDVDYEEVYDKQKL
ncbi:hypothetical protein KSP39_PZI006081 [Platanthera zijinensis]|uniref:Uncharacterized protein n=1 Tax=Platanthera zijinensis TaxID=2320716 RepID=A0AAP0BSP2_9ASPA